MSQQEINFATLAAGAVQEVFDHELKKVFENIMDVNTPSATKRKLVLEITLSPNDERDMAQVDFQVKKTLAPIKAVTSAIVMGKDGSGNIIANEVLKQVKGQQFFAEALTGGKITPIAR